MQSSKLKTEHIDNGRVLLWCSLLWSPCVADADIIFVLFRSFFFLFFPRLPYFHTWCDLSANLECRSEMCCTRFTGNAGPKKCQKSPFAHHRTTLSGYIFPTKARIDNRKKNLLSSNLLHMSLVNFGPLVAEIVSLVSGHPR